MPAADAQRVYCTYFDSLYLARGVAMLRSLRLHDPLASIHVLALDVACAHILEQTFERDVHVIELAELHAYDPALAQIRETRSAWAFYATQKPALVRFLFDRRPRARSIAYIDADTWFFADPEPLFAEIGDASIAVSPHRFSPGSEHLLRYGRYNAGLIYWRADEVGRRCVEDWRSDCLSWCDEQPQDDGRFMNQGYLNGWPERYPRVHVVEHPGVNLAPWNADNHALSAHGDGVLVDGRPLVFFHFSGLMLDETGAWCSFYPHADRQADLTRDRIYGPYLAAVEEERRAIREKYGVEETGSVRAELTVSTSHLRFSPG
jgi:hypothetical protein